MEKWEQIIKNVGLPRETQKVYIWGAGNTAVLAHQGMLRENLYQAFHINAFLDSKQAGTDFFGFPVYDPKVLDIEKSEDLFVFICTTNPKVYYELGRVCNEKGISNCLLDAAILKCLKKRFQETSLLLDEASRKIYCRLLANRAVACEMDAELYAGESYFGIPEFCRCCPGDIIVDCGAYVGDSAERYMWRMEQFKKYIAIEPDINNYRAMSRRFNRLRTEWNFPEEKLECLFGGVDEVTCNHKVESRVDGLGSIATEDAPSTAGIVHFWALDDLMKDGFTFLKADIESYEYKMLCGAKECIKKSHPRMAICIYHNMVDMFSIPQLIKKIDPSYRLAVRHHSFGYEETVLYAY